MIEESAHKEQLQGSHTMIKNERVAKDSWMQKYNNEHKLHILLKQESELYKRQ